MAELTVASFNTHWGVDRQGRPFDVVGACLALDADVLVLQECWRPHGAPAYVDTVATRLGAGGYDIAFTSDRGSARPRHLVIPPGPAGTCGLAVLSRLPVLAVRGLRFPHAFGDVIAHRHSLILTVEIGPVTVAVAGVHASHRLWGSLPQLRAIDRALTAAGTPSVIAGDCNMWGPPVGAALRGRRRAVRARTWPAEHPHSQIDHLWIDDRFEVVSGDVGPVTGSDHLPIRARLRVL